MKNGQPLVYWAFRMVWSAIQVALIAAAVAILVIWATTDDQGARTLAEWVRWTDGLHRSLSSLIRYPWG